MISKVAGLVSVRWSQEAVLLTTMVETTALSVMRALMLWLQQLKAIFLRKIAWRCWISNQPFGRQHYEKHLDPSAVSRGSRPWSRWQWSFDPCWWGRFTELPPQDGWRLWACLDHSQGRVRPSVQNWLTKTYQYQVEINPTTWILKSKPLLNLAYLVAWIARSSLPSQPVRF